MEMNVELIEISCCNCGVIFWITDKHDDQLRRKHTTFYCPNGHQMSYPGDTCEEKLKRAERTIADKDYWLGCSTRSNSALRGVITKMKNKAE